MRFDVVLNRAATIVFVGCLTLLVACGDDEPAPQADSGKPMSDRDAGGDGDSDGGEPPVDGGKASADGGESPADGGEPPVDGGEPPVDGGEPPADGGEPLVDGGEPPVDGGEPPVASFTATKVTGEAPVELHFTNTSVVPDDQTVSFEWDFGDGSSSSDRDPAHLYTEPGTYTVALTATTSGGSDTYTREDFVVIVSVLTPPDAPIFLTAIAEIEFNDNPTQATVVSGALPFAVSGAIQQDIDGDYFRFTASADEYVTFALSTSAEGFRPRLDLASATGDAVPAFAVQPPGGSHRAAIAARIPSAGTYYLIVNDADSQGDPSFSYRVGAFVDGDSDGLSDALELAYDGDPLTQDFDRDGIADGAELLVFDENGLWRPDFDGDGQLNGADEDSDNDGVLDALERVADGDRDGMPAFVDFDSDDNGLDDRLEAGSEREVPRDRDFDADPDFVDTDNDGDSLRDDIDTAADEALAPNDVLAPSAIHLRRAQVVLAQGAQHARGVARAGDLVRLIGTGIPDALDACVVVLSGGAQSQSAAPDAVADGALDFTLPAGDFALEAVALFCDDALSNAVPLRALPIGAPLLFATQAPSAQAGAELELSGADLGLVSSVQFTAANGESTASASPLLVDASTVRVTVPDGARSGYVTVSSARGTSNSIPFRLIKSASAVVTPPASASFELDELHVLWGLLDDAAPDGSGNVAELTIPGDRVGNVQVVLALDTPAAIVVLEAATLPDDDAIALDAMSTAVARVLAGVGFEERSAPERWLEDRAAIALLPEVEAFASVIEAQLELDPNYVLDPPSEYVAALQAAVLAADGYFDNMAGVSTLRAIITPEQQEDVSLYQTGDTGDVTIENDTQLYLSVRMTEAGTGAVLRPHIDSFLDSNAIDPQDYGLIFYATEEPLEQPNGRDADLEVLTGGFGTPWDARPASQYLFGRSLALRILWPTINFVIDLDPDTLVGILVDKAPDILEAGYQATIETDVAGGALEVVKAIGQDIGSVPPGPLTEGFAEAVGSTTAQELIAQLAQRIALRLAPGVGQLLTALESADAISDGTQVGVAIADIALTPGVLYFTVRWPLDVTRVEPQSIQPGQGETTVRIFGEGFSPITEDTLTGTTTSLPVVTFTNDSNTTYEVPVPAWSISPNGMEMAAVLPESYVESLSGVALDLTVRHGGAVVTLEDAIRIANHTEIHSLTPNTGAGGSFVGISGAGFSVRREGNLVTFAGEEGARLQATVVEATPSFLVVIVPAGVVTGSVTVDVGDDISNEVPFTISGELVSIRIGDTGSIVDDTYGLYVDGQHIHSMVAPANVVGPFSLALAEGLHEVVLRGNATPDAIGTYAIEFTGYVANVQGDALFGDDLPAGVEKRWTITVGRPPPTPEPLRVSATPDDNVFGPPPGLVLSE